MNDPRSQTPEGKETIRDRVILYLVDHFNPKNKDGTDKVPDNVILFDPSDPAKGPLFDISIRGTLDDISERMTPGLAIEEGDEEQTQNLFPFTDKKFRLFFNFKVIKQTGVDVYSLLNYYLGRLEQELVRPEIDGLHVAELTMSVETAGNSLQYNGGSDPEPGATAMFDFEIRHVLGDPFTETYDG